MVDLCRQCIIFEDVASVAACLQCIASDPEVRIVRIKNRLDRDYDSAQSAGYRDVGLNLRLVGPETRSLGLHAHVCEVQLILRSFADLKVRDYTRLHDCASDWQSGKQASKILEVSWKIRLFFSV